MRIAIAAGGRAGDALAHRINRHLGDGTTKYEGITVIRPSDPSAGNRWDVIIVLPEPVEASETERAVYRQWLVEYVPTKLAHNGEIIRL